MATSEQVVVPEKLTMEPSGYVTLACGNAGATTPGSLQVAVAKVMV